MNRQLAALQALDRATAEYETEGYTVTFEERLPAPFAEFKADAIVRRGTELVVIEVRPSDLTNQTRERLARLGDVVAAQEGWRVDVVTYEPDTQPPEPAVDDILRRVDEVRRIVELSPDAAMLLIWSAVEGALLTLSERQGLEPRRSVAPRALIRELTINGVISDNQAELLDDFARQRNEVAHGLRSPQLDTSSLEAQRLAQEVANSLDDEATTSFALVDLARARLTEAHPLTQIVSKGVAFHHAALPVDIQAEIEDAVRSGQIRILIATSTLIEGVNLPFKTVIVGRQGYTNADGEQIEAIDAPGLLNAVGRAGRAGRETEGWMILTEQSAAYNSAMFDPLQRTGNDLDIRSTLTAADALAGLDAFETLARTAQDAIFSHFDPVADGFLSFIWFVAQALEDLNQSEASIDEVMAVVEHTLAWQQLDPEQRQPPLQAAEAAVDAFEAQPVAERARFARSGTSLPTARTLDSVAEHLLARLDADTTVDLEDLLGVLDFVLDGHTLEALLGLAENDRRGFKPYRSAPRDLLVAVDVKALLMDWVGGVEIQDLADQHLTGIDDDGYRSETLAEFSASVFEHHLPWTLGIVLQWVNGHLDSTGSERRLPDHLPAAIHYGVSTETALDLMHGGIRSRRLANAVAAQAPARTAMKILHFEIGWPTKPSAAGETSSRPAQQKSLISSPSLGPRARRS